MEQPTIKLQNRIQKLAKTRGTLRSKDLNGAGIARSQLSRMVAAGQLNRVARGLYTLPDFQGGEHHSLALVATRLPDALFCLLTALRFHDLTTQSPFEVWIAIGNKARPPRLDYPPLRVVRFSDATLKAGIEMHIVDGVKIRVTSVARTVVDCFKFRHKIGLDVALETLREARRVRTNMDDLWRYAKLCRVANVMRPYLDSLT